MKQTILLCILSFLFLASCSTTKYAYQANYLPKPSQNLEFGMALAKWKQDHPTAVNAGEDYGFRVIYLEDEAPAPFESIVYYFDNEEDIPLYELVLNYHDSTVRDAWIRENLGAPNHANGKEWLYDSGEGFEIRIWTFQNKLVIAAAIAGCEWDENRDGVMDAPVEG